MNHGNGVSRGDRNRNTRLARLRELVPLDHAIVGIDQDEPVGFWHVYRDGKIKRMWP